MPQLYVCVYSVLSVFFSYLKLSLSYLYFTIERHTIVRCLKWITALDTLDTISNLTFLQGILSVQVFE